MENKELAAHRAFHVCSTCSDAGPSQRFALAARRFLTPRAEEDERQNGKSKLGHQMKGTPPEGSHGSRPLQCGW